MLINTVNGKGYVGQTLFSVAKRVSAHIKASRVPDHRRRSGISNAIAKYGSKSFQCITLRACDTQKDLDATEIAFIAYYQTTSPFGYNLRTGGNGGHLSNETKAKISATKRKQHRRMSEDHKAKLISSILGKKQSPEHIEKRIAPHRGRKLPREHVERVAAANRGKHRSAKHRAAISAANKGRKQSPEFVEKRIARHRGMKRSASAKAKMSASAKARQDRVRGPDGRFIIVSIALPHVQVQP